MKIIQVPFCFYPDNVGGTEVYVDWLARALVRTGAGIVIAAPGPRDATYVHEGLRVRRVAVRSGRVPIRELYGSGDALAAAGFGRVLDEERPDVLHVHGLTSAVSWRVLREAEKRGVPVVYTFHTPTAVCQRGSMMRWGSVVCDGKMRVHVCASCALHGFGVPLPAAVAVGSLPCAVSGALMELPIPSTAKTALGMTSLVRAQHDATRRFLLSAAHVVAVAEWARTTLILNGVKENRITVSTHALPAFRPARVRALRAGGPLKIAFLGRLDPAKGAHLLIEALAARRELDVRLDVYGIVQANTEERYRQRFAAAAAADSRVTLREPVPSSEVVDLLSSYDALAVPSQWLETGPLVVLEALAAGTPVIGSDLGSISGHVRTPAKGMLVADYRSADAWGKAIEAFAARPSTVGRPQAVSRTMDDVAAEMILIYKRVFAERAAG